MKTIKIILISILLLVFSGCKGQKSGDGSSMADTQSGSLINKKPFYNPKIDIKVNKQYDKEGRMVKFDSTYSYFYASPKVPPNFFNDSLFKSFHSFFENGFLNGGYTNNRMFFNDTLFKQYFLNDNPDTKSF